MLKNVATKVSVTAYDASTGLFKTGDAANLTLYVSIDGAAYAALADTSATEYDATNNKGEYWFDVAAAETNGDVLVFRGKSTTSNIQIVPKTVITKIGVGSPLVGEYPYLGIADSGTSQAVGATTLTAQTSAPTCVTTNTSSVGKILRLTNGANAGAMAKVTSNVGSTKVLTFSGGWSNGATPSGTPTYILFDAAPDGITAAIAALNNLSQADVRTAVGLASANTDTQLAAIQTSASNIQTRLPSTLSGGFLQADVRSVMGDVMSKTGTASDGSGKYTT